MFVVHTIKDFGMENNTYSGDGVITGSGKVNNRLVIFMLKTLPFLVGLCHQRMLLKL